MGIIGSYMGSIGPHIGVIEPHNGVSELHNGVIESHMGIEEAYLWDGGERLLKNGTKHRTVEGHYSVERVYRVADASYAYAEGGHDLAKIGNRHADY